MEDGLVLHQFNILQKLPWQLCTYQDVLPVLWLAMGDANEPTKQQFSSTTAQAILLQEFSAV